MYAKQRVLSSRTAFKAAVQPARPVLVRAAKEDNGAPGPIVNLDELTDIIRLVNSTDIVELELHSKKFNLSLKKKEALKQPEPVYQMVAAPMAAPMPAPAAAAPAPAPAAAPAAARPAAAPAAAAPAKPAKADGLELKSPMAGTFYTRPGPGEPQFVKLGDRVKKGQVVGIIEAMKLMNEIEAETAGEVVAFLVDNGKPVVPGQGLLVIKP